MTSWLSLNGECVIYIWKLTEGVGCSSSRTILPTPVSGWDSDGEGSARVHITGVLSHSKHCTGTTTIDCDCHLLHTRCWGHIDIIMIDIKQFIVWWSYPASCDSNTSSTRDSLNLVHSNIQWSSWYICHEKIDGVTLRHKKSSLHTVNILCAELQD